MQMHRAVQGKGKLELLWDNTLYHYDDLPFNNVQDMSDVFTPFKSKASPQHLVYVTDHLQIIL